MTKAINYTMTSEEKRQLKLNQLKAEMVGMIMEYKGLDKKIANSLITMTLNQVLEYKKQLKSLSRKIKSYRGRLKKMGVEFDEYGNIENK